MKVLVTDIVQETKDATTICFKNGNFFKKFKYKPGQFLTIHVPIDGSVHKRAYSFSSSPFKDKTLNITIKRVNGGLVSNYVHDNIKVGDKLKVDDPAGSFFIEPKKDDSKQYILFAGGSGITPVYSIAQSVLLKEPDSNVFLVYANQNKESIIFHKELEALEAQYPNNFNIEHILADGDEEKDNYSSGFLTKELLDDLFGKYGLHYADDYKYMICGPAGYMDKVKEILKENGIGRDKIMLEAFKAPKVKLTGKNLLSKVTIRFKGKEHQINVKGDMSILQQAMSDNIALPYSCRSGMCSTCKAKCVSGEVKMIEGHLLPESDVANGEILTCVSYPASENIEIEL